MRALEASLFQVRLIVYLVYYSECTHTLPDIYAWMGNIWTVWLQFPSLPTIDHAGKTGKFWVQIQNVNMLPIPNLVSLLNSANWYINKHNWNNNIMHSKIARENTHVIVLFNSKCKLILLINSSRDNNNLSQAIKRINVKTTRKTPHM